MNVPSGGHFRWAVVWLLVGMPPGVQAVADPCEEAWKAYNELKARSSMEASQYPLTAQGAAVRAACGKTALPAPENADISPVPPRVRPKRLPPKSPQPVKPDESKMSPRSSS